NKKRVSYFVFGTVDQCRYNRQYLCNCSAWIYTCFWCVGHYQYGPRRNIHVWCIYGRCCDKYTGRAALACLPSGYPALGIHGISIGTICITPVTPSKRCVTLGSTDQHHWGLDFFGKSGERTIWCRESSCRQFVF